MALSTQFPSQSPEEIENLWQTVQDQLAEGTQYPGMSYEEGILATLRWLYERGDHPFMGQLD